MSEERSWDERFNVLASPEVEARARRDVMTEQLIAEAREPATDAEVQAQAEDPQLVAAKPHHAPCAADVNHSGVCTRADGTAILVKRSEVPMTNAGKLDSVLKAIDDGRLSPQAAHRVMDSAPDAFERTMQAEIDAAPPPEPTYVLTGAELVAYARMRAAAFQAHAAQQAAASAGQALREAMQAWGAVVAPGKEP